MKLGTYLDQNDISLADFASRIGVANASVVQRYVSGTRTPRPDPMRAIVRETNGAVQPNDFFEQAAAA